MKLCECGCGVAIGHLHVNTRFAPACARLRQIMGKRLKRKNKETVRTKRRHVVVNRYESEQHRTQKICPACGDMPSARTVDRTIDGCRHGRSVLDPSTGRCRGCGELPGPDEPLEHGPLLQSSATWVAKHGEYYAY